MVGVGVPLALQVKATLPWGPWLIVTTMLLGADLNFGPFCINMAWMKFSQC